MENTPITRSEKRLGDVLARLAIAERGSPALSLLFQPPGMRPCLITDLFEPSPAGRQEALAAFEQLNLDAIQQRINDFQGFFSSRLDRHCQF